jgi:hypothetical protein
MGGIFESFALLREDKEEAGEELTQAADRIQAWRKDRKLYSCRQDTEREERQGSYCM